jgi:HIT zinc finger
VTSEEFETLFLSILITVCNITNIRYRAVHKNRSFERVVMDQGYYTDPMRRSVGGVKGVESRTSIGNKNSSGNSSSSSSSLSTSTMNYCNIYINTSSSGSARASLESGTDDTALLPYLSIAALPSKSATRYFCSVCGFFGTYTCTRCGCRFCCTKCLASHKETRCLKFSY